MMDAFVTAELIATDLTSADNASASEKSPIELDAWVGKQRLVSWQDWQTIDQEERRRGAQRGKEREKITSLSEMLTLVQ